mgnify:CR=1 FL=1
MSTSKITGVILAGGKNQRMNGKVKALLPFGGEPVIVRQIHRMRPVCDHIVVVTRFPGLFADVLDKSIHVIEDRIPGKGPLSGMHAAFTFFRRTTAWVVACDMPFISAEASRLMIKRKEQADCDAVIPQSEAHLHPLHGIYDTGCGEVLTALLKSGKYRMTDLLKELDWQAIDENVFRKHGIEYDFTFNMNTPEDYRLALAIANKESQ